MTGNNAASSERSPMLVTPLGRFPVGADGEPALENAVQTGEVYSFKADTGVGEPVFFKGTVRRATASDRDYVLDCGPRAITAWGQGDIEDT